MKMNKKGFTLIELLVVIAIIGLLSTLSILALNTARARSRDARRVADIKQIQTALEMYFNDAGIYPANAGVANNSPITYASSTYLAAVPVPPTPTNDGTCPTLSGVANLYTYVQTDSGLSYTLKYCLGAAVNDIPAGLRTATPAGMR